MPRIELFAVERGEQRRAGLHVKAHSRSQVQLAGSVLAGRNIYGAAAGAPAGVDGLLQAGRALSCLRPVAP